jgi:hypothetical protein
MGCMHRSLTTPLIPTVLPDDDPSACHGSVVGIPLNQFLIVIDTIAVVNQEGIDFIRILIRPPGCRLVVHSGGVAIPGLSPTSRAIR